MPDISHLASPGHQLLMTRFGPLDLLGAIGDGKSYDDLIEQTSKEDLENMSVYLLNLESIQDSDKTAYMVRMWMSSHHHF